MKNNFFESLIHDCFNELFLNSTPSANYDELSKIYPLNKRGYVEVTDMNYKISEKIANEIIDKYVNQLTNIYFKRLFLIIINSSCSPIFIKS